MVKGNDAAPPLHGSGRDQSTSISTDNKKSIENFETTLANGTSPKRTNSRANSSRGSRKRRSSDFSCSSTWRDSAVPTDLTTRAIRSSSFDADKGDDGDLVVVGSTEDDPSSGRRGTCGSSVNHLEDLHFSLDLHEAILFPERLEALRACDANIVTYNHSSFLMVFRLDGRNMGMIGGPLLCLLLWAILWEVLVAQFPTVREYADHLEDLVSPLLLPVSFLLVFRLGRAAVRYWDARAAAGKIVELCRAFISTAAVGCSCGSSRPSSSSHALIEGFARWTCVFPIAAKNFLRPDERKGWHKTSRNNKHRFEIGPLLTEKDARDVLDSDDSNNAGDYVEFSPILVLNRLRQLAYRASAVVPPVASGDDGKTSDAAFSAAASAATRAMLYRQLNEQLDVLTGAWGAMERINATPLPFVYVVHLRTFLILYLLLWYVASIARNGWVALPALIAGSWALLGIEAAAVECEQPFKWHSNHLALGKMCVVVSQNVAQTLRNLGFES